jgi:transcriptional regulator with XRE-family HTH domain
MPDPPKSNAALAEAIRTIRKRERLTQEELAARAGVHLTWVNRLESGRYDLQWSSLEKIVKGLGTSMVEVVALTERLELD